MTTTLDISHVLLVGLVSVACTTCLAAQEKPAATGTIIGRVVDALGVPIIATEVVARRSSPPGPVLAKSRTDGEGMFVLARLPLSDDFLAVYATAPGGVVARSMDIVRVTARNPRTTALVRVWDAADVRGRAVDERGDPVARVVVAAAFDGSRLFAFEPSAETVTDKDGRFVLSKVPLGSINVRGFADGYAASKQLIYVEKAMHVDLVMKKGNGIALSVTVKGIEAGDRWRARVRVLPYGGAGAQALPARWTNGRLDDSGIWSVEGLPDLEYLVVVTLDGYVFEPRSLRGKPKGGPHRFVFRARRRAATKLQGVLRSADGTPLVGETVLCRTTGYPRASSRAVTDSEGAFTLDSPVWSGEECTLQLVGTRWMIKGKTVTTADPGKRLDVRAIRSSRVLGRVVDSRGRPVGLVRLTLEQRGGLPGARWSLFARSTTDRHGRFTFEGLHARGGLRVRVIGPAGAGLSKTFRIGSGEEHRDIGVIVAPPGVVEGVILDGEGKPIPGARVKLGNWDVQRDRQTDGGIVEVLTDRNGRFRHLGVEPGGHYLEVHVVRVAYLGHQKDTFEVKVGQVVKRKLLVPR